MAGIDDARQPFQRYVGTQQGHRLSVAVVNGDGVGTKHHPRPCVVVVRLAPVASPGLDAVLVELGLQVVVRLTAYLSFIEAAVGTLCHVWLEPATLLRVVVGTEHQRRSHDGWVVLHHPAKDGIE